MTRRQEKKPSEYDNCIKLDVIASAQGASVSARVQPPVEQLIAGHPDAIHRIFRTEHAQVFCFESVYYGSVEQGRDGWQSCRRFVCVSVHDMYKALFRNDLRLHWKTLYEVVLEARARNLYFDLEVRREDGMSAVDIKFQDCECWRLVQQLKQAVCDTFKCAFKPSTCYGFTVIIHCI
jgi:hypothetical protein